MVLWYVIKGQEKCIYCNDNKNLMIQLRSFLILGNQLPDLCLEPSPPPPQAQDNKRKREMMFDYEIKLNKE
jgi:hypothetical protein